MTDRNEFDAETTTDEVLEGIDLTGKLVLVTGGSSGLGAEAARAFASKGARVIITARNLEKATGVAAGIADKTGASVEVEELELGNLAAIRAFADRINARGEKIDILLNNAGVMACPQSETDDGFELQFGSNHLGHFLMTNLIAPSLADGGRIVNLSSSGHGFSPVVFEDIMFENREYNKWLAYGQAKTANALFAVGLNARLAGRDIEAFSVHPGAIMTDLARHLTEDDRKMFEGSLAAGTLKMKSVEQGAATGVYACTAPEIEGRGGAYLADCRIAEVAEDGEQYTTVKPYAVDPAQAQRLWSVSEELVGQSFAY
ncbi:SDR family NAD(P)-dependent oxidoreductase [Oricola sp.]|uniref:SDR family NAD(P)-dependent oxidoreductase n=1 Tax=Oricola sp. TaxID=1979950 RepID=UPI003BAD35E8